MVIWGAHAVLTHQAITICGSGPLHHTRAGVLSNTFFGRLSTSQVYDSCYEHDLRPQIKYNPAAEEDVAFSGLLGRSDAVTCL